MWTAIYHGYIGFAVTLFAVVGAFSVMCIACMILLMLAHACIDLFVALKSDYDEYKLFRYYEPNFVLWLDSIGYNLKWDEETNRMKWVKNDDKK